MLQAHCIVSLIFTTINKDLTGTITGVETLSNKMGILGNSFSDIINAYNVYGKQGLKNIFANTNTGLVTSLDKEMLQNYFDQISNGVPKVEALQNTMFGASKGARELALSVDVSKQGLKDFETKINGVKIAEQGYTATTIGAKIATVALQTAISFGISLAIQGLITLFQKLKEAIPTPENTSKWLDESSKKVEEAKAEVEELSDKLTTTKERIEELQNLQKQGKLTIVEQSELNKLQSANVELEKQLDLKKKYLQTQQDENQKNFISNVNSLKNGYNVSPIIADSDVFEGMKKRARGEVPSLAEGSFEWDDKLVLQAVHNYQSALDKLGDYDYDSLSKEAQQAIDYIKDVENAYYALNEDTSDNSMAFDSIYNQERFAKGKEALEGLKTSGELTGESLEKLYNGTDEGSKSFKAMVDNMQHVGLIDEITSDTFAELANQIRGTGEAAETTSNEVKNMSFSDLMKDKTFTDQVNDYKDKLTELDEALEKLRSGDLGEEDKIELFKNFPELAGQADNLDEAIVNLINDTEGSVIADFNEQLGNMDTDESRAALNALKNSILGLAKTKNGVADLKSEISKLKTALDDLKSTYDTIQDVIENRNENGYLTLDNLQSIMDLEPEYINLLIDENGQINLNSQAYKEYVASKAKSLLVNELQDLYSSILGMKVEEAQAYANAKAYNEETRSVQDLLTATTQLYYAKAMAKDSANNTTAYTDAMSRSFNTAANYASMVDSYINSLSTSQNEFNHVTNEATDSTNDYKDALEAEKDALEDTKDSLEDYKDKLSDAQSSLKDLIDLVTDYIKQTKEDEKSALEEQIDTLDKQKDALDESKEKYADLIDKKKEAIKAAYDEKKAQDELLDKQKSVAKDRLALEVAGLDDSSAGRKAQKQARDNLAESEKSLHEYQDERAYDFQIKELEDLQTKFEEGIEKRKAQIDIQVEHIETKIDEIDKYLDNSRQMYEDACAMIDNDNGTLYSNLWNYTYTYTTQTKAEFDHLWTSAQEALAKYRGDNDSLLGVMETLQTEIYNTEGQIADLDLQIDEVGKSIDVMNQQINNSSGVINNVSSSIGGLASNIADYKRALDELANANNNSGVPLNAKWTFEYADTNGQLKTAWSTSSDFETAVRDIQSVIEKETGYYRPDVFGGIKKHFASGTRHSPAEFISQEKGLEAIFAKKPNSSGSYTLTTPDSQVFDSKRTDNLYNFSGNPEEFISKLAERGLSLLSGDELSALGWGRSIDVSQLFSGLFNSPDFVKNLTGVAGTIYNNDNSASNDVYSISMPIQIYGNPDQSVVQAFNRLMPTFKKEMINELVRIGEKYRR